MILPPTGSSPQPAFKAPARSTQSRLSTTSAARMSWAASALGLLPAGGPCHLSVGGNPRACLGGGRPPRAEPLGQSDPALPLRFAASDASHEDQRPLGGIEE